MKFRDLEGNIISKDISRYKWSGRAASEGERSLGEKLRDLFPSITIYAQLPCVGTRLKLDYYIYDLKMAFEFDGRQHDEHVPFYHGDKRGFARAQERDQEKEEWCEINDIKLIRITEKELDIESLTRKIIGR